MKEIEKLDRRKITEEIGRILSEFDIIEVVYVFGSFVHNPDFNDVDVALLISKKLKPYERFKLKMKVARELERKIKPRFEFDVKILNYSPLEFQYEVLKTGKAVFIRNASSKIEYEAGTISKYLDFRDIVKEIDKSFLAEV